MKFPLRLIGILSVCAVPAGVSAASWTPVSCPEAARPLAGQYELVRMIEDFEDGPGGWASHRGVQQAESAAAVDAFGGWAGACAVTGEHSLLRALRGCSL